MSDDMRSTTVEPTDEFNQQCIDIVENWRDNGVDETIVSTQLMNLIQNAQKQNHKANQARGYTALAHLYNNMGKYDKSIMFAKLAERFFKDVNNLKRLAGVYVSMGEIYRLKGDNSQAANMYEKALEIAKQRNNPVHIMFATGNYGHVALAAKNYTKARDLLEEALHLLIPYLANEENIHWLAPPSAVKCEYESALAEAYLYLDAYDNSWKAVEESYKLALNFGLPIEQAMILRTVGQLVLKQPDHSYTQFDKDYHYYFDEAYKLFKENGAEGDAAITRLTFGRLMLENNETQKAKEYFEKAAKQFTRLGMFALAKQSTNLAQQI